MHDGRDATLIDRVNDGNASHGATTSLSQQQKLDLVEYLKTL